MLRALLSIAIILAFAPAMAEPVPQFTPITMRVLDRLIPVKGSDGDYHVVYELELSNLTADPVTLNRLEVRDAKSDRVVAVLDVRQLASRLVVRDKAAKPRRMGPSQTGILYLHLAFEDNDEIPRVLEHVLSGVVGTKQVSEKAARVLVAQPTDLVLDAPLRGPRYIAGDGCCDSVRHIRASLPFDGRVFTAQRFAIDWEQLDDRDRIYVGDPKNPASYIIYGKPAYAVADARVVTAVDGLPDSPPGQLPPDLPLDQADGNHVVLDLGDGRYALYAHFKPGSVRVRKDDVVRRGQVLGLVGTSGNSSEPHLHFHVTDGPSTFASHGVPYLLRSFTSSRRGVSTAAFDQAILDGQPIATEPVAGPPLRRDALPLDLWIVDFE